jgi:hypothetical protein
VVKDSRSDNWYSGRHAYRNSCRARDRSFTGCRNEFTEKTQAEN